MKKTFLLLLIIVFCLVTQGHAQEEGAYKEKHHGKSADEVAKELANPNNDLARLTFKNRYYMYRGDLPRAHHQSNYTLVFQPVFPFSLGTSEEGDKSVLFVRPAIPIVFDQPVPSVSSRGNFQYNDYTSLGDIVTDVGYGKTHKNGFLWLAGLVSTLPTATVNEVAGKQFRLGPELVLGKISKRFVYAFFPSHQWNVAGWSNDYYSKTEMQWIFEYLPGGGWNIGTQPIMDYDWVTDDWTIPVQLLVSRTITVGKRPLKLEFEINYYVEQPDEFGPKWMFGFNITPIVNNFVERWIKGK